MKHPPQARFFASAPDFWCWLEEDHDTATELWVGYYKKGTRHGGLTYAEAVEEALCFGWIDGQVRRPFAPGGAARLRDARPTQRRQLPVS